MSGLALDSIARGIVLEIPPSSVVLLQNLLESYENLATIRTLNAARGLVVLLTTKDFEPLTRSVVSEFSETHFCREVETLSAEEIESIIPTI